VYDRKYMRSINGESQSGYMFVEKCCCTWVGG
jgi:hypothetical protein